MPFVDCKDRYIDVGDEFLFAAHGPEIREARATALELDELIALVKDGKGRHQRFYPHDSKRIYKLERA
jgi:hypothetical protein